MDKIDELLSRGVANIIPSKDKLKELLESGKKLNVYLGIDPTSTRIHLGHAVSLRKLAKFAELGHNVTFLIGDFTALIGDTSDKESERPVLTSEEIEENFKTYKEQAEKILDFSKIEVKKNSEWLGNLSFKEVVKLAQEFSFGDFASRELIKKRLSSSKHVGLHEGLYPAMQGYDSYMLDTDIQIGGTDQTFNMQAGRILQKNWRKKESYIIATEFLDGTDGRKMSKTWDNAIWLDEAPADMYRKIMAINDDLIIKYFILATDLSLNAVSNLEDEVKTNPLGVKKELAREIVKELHGEKEAEDAENNFTSVVQYKERVFESKTVELHDPFNSNATIAGTAVASGVVESMSEARRIIEQGGMYASGEKVTDPKAPTKNYEKNNEVEIKRGKFNSVKVKPSK